MKKSIILSAFVLAALTANAQTTVQGSKFTDNWSIELKTGIITPVSHSAFFKNARPALGIELTKQLTPVFGLGVQGMGYINTSNSKTAFDASDLSFSEIEVEIHAETTGPGVHISGTIHIVVQPSRTGYGLYFKYPGNTCIACEQVHQVDFTQ